MPDRDEDEVLTIKAAAEVLDVSEKTLRRWDKAGNSARNVMGTGCTLAAKFLELRKQIFSGIEKAHEGTSSSCCCRPTRKATSRRSVRLRCSSQRLRAPPATCASRRRSGRSSPRGELADILEDVTSFLQLVDADMSGSILVAATNHVELLDGAVFRRFDVIVPFDKPTREQVAELMKFTSVDTYRAHGGLSVACRPRWPHSIRSASRRR